MLGKYLHVSYHGSSLLPFSRQSYYFDRQGVALHGFSKYFKKSAMEELEHAERLMKFQNQRGGRIVFRDIEKPDKDDWGTGEGVVLAQRSKCRTLPAVC